MKIQKSELQIESLVNRISAKEIDLQPNFQRGEIWDLKRRQRLIDTILRNWYVPAVHIVEEPDGGEVVLDGQQRLAAIRDFVADKIRVDGEIDPPNENIRSLHGKKFSQLPASVQRAINRFSLQVITLTDYQPQEPNELFFRLNQSYNLTPPEKRNALHGVARDQVKELVEAMTEFGLLDRQTIGFSNGRLAYDDIVARVCVAIENGTLRQHINNSVVEEYYRTREFSDATIEGVRSSGQTLLELLQQPELKVKFNKGTLQTWLVYCYWAPVVTGPIPPRLLQAFESERLEARSGGTDLGEDAIEEVLRIYADRASYRVTDVSSVVARDLAIHLFSMSRFKTPGRRGSGDFLDRVSQIRLSEIGGQYFEYLAESSWGNPVLEDVAAR